MRFRTLVVLGSITLTGLSLYNILSQKKPVPPSLEGMTTSANGSQPADKYASAAQDLCTKSIDTILMCQALQRKYPALTTATINMTVQFSRYYGHKNPSALLALQLVENEGDILDGESDKSTAFGPFHYLVDTFCDKLVTDRKVVGNGDIRNKNMMLIRNVKQHFPDNPKLIDDVASICQGYMAQYRADKTLRKAVRKSLKLKKEERAAKIQEINARITKRRGDMRKTLLEQYPLAVIAIQYVHKLTTVNPDRLYNGTAYGEHIFQDDMEILLSLQDQERKSTTAHAKAVAAKQTIAPPQEITAAQIKLMLERINAVNGKEYKELVLPTNAGAIYPAFDSRLSNRAPGNLSLFFKVQRIKQEVDGPRDAKGVATKLTKIRTIVVPLTANQIQEEIMRRWEAHHKNARPLDLYASELSDNGLAPSMPTKVRTAQKANGGPTVAQN